MIPEKTNSVDSELLPETQSETCCSDNQNSEGNSTEIEAIVDTESTNTKSADIISENEPQDFNSKEKPPNNKGVTNKDSPPNNPFDIKEESDAKALENFLEIPDDNTDTKPETHSDNVMQELMDYVPTGLYEPISIVGKVHKEIIVPPELANKNIWICHCNKVPCSPNGKYSVNINNKKEYVTYNEACDAVKKYGHDGVSIVLNTDYKLCCVDIDHCINNSVIHPSAMNIIEKIGSYAEVSTSGTGIHIFLFAENHPEWRKKIKNALTDGVDLEIYFEKRQMVFTGRGLIGYEKIKEANTALEYVYCKYAVNPNKKQYNNLINSEPPPPTTVEGLYEYLRNDKNGAKYLAALEHGDKSAFNTTDDSSIDWSILMKLIFYCTDPDVLYQVMYNSAIKRDKWDEKRGNKTYLEYIIDKALARQTNHYHPLKKSQQKNNDKPIALQTYDGDFSFSYDFLLGYKTDAIGLSELYGKVIENVIVYTAFNKSFYIYDGCVWKQDTGETILSGITKKFIKYTILVIERKIHILEDMIRNSKDKEAEDLKNKLEIAKSLQAFYSRQSEYGARKKLMLDVRNEIAIDYSMFNSHEEYLNFQNGTFDLKTFQLKPHSSKDYLTQVTACEYNPNAKCERFVRFIDEITLNRSDIKEYLHKACGYMISGSNELECMFIAYGKSSRNGKSTLYNALRHVLADYAISADVEIITKKSGKGGGDPKPELLQLNKKRLIYFAEPDINSTLQGGLIKQITGGDRLRARGLFTNDFVEFKCTSKMIIACNTLPRLNDSSIIDSNRVKIIPFDKHFAEEERDTTLTKQFSSPEAMSGIMNWLIEGYKMYLQDGLKPYKGMSELLKRYEKSYNEVSEFVEECLTVYSEDNNTKCSTLKNIWGAYKGFCEEKNYRLPSMKRFVDELSKNGIEIFDKNHQKYIHAELKISSYLYGTETTNFMNFNSDKSWRRGKNS